MKLNWITNNLLIKIGALLLALALWFYVAGEEKVELEFKIPIELNLAEEVVVTEQNATELRILVSGRKEVISRLTEKQLSSKIDLTNHNELQTIIFPVDRHNVPVDSDIKVLKIVPINLIVKIDKLTEAVLPVEVVTKGKPATGYKIEGFVIDPISALVKGPEKYLDKLKYIKTESIDVTGRRKSFKKMVPLESIPMVGEKIPPQFVEVVVRIEEESRSFFR